MQPRYVITTLLLAILLLFFTFQVPSASGESPTPTEPTVTLRAASGATIAFTTQNGKKIGGVSPQTLGLSHLVLYRNGRLTHPDERTLILEVSGIDVPPGGVTLTLELTTQHGNPDLGGRSDQRIPVWRGTQWLANPARFNKSGGTAIFTHEFSQTVISGTEMIATPTDYFQYDLTVTAIDHPVTNPLRILTGEYAFLMENQWVTRLPDVPESSPGAAPDELIIYYCDMFSFQQSSRDHATWLPRAEVSTYVDTKLIPQLVETFRVQSDEWGFPWHQAWIGYRLGEDAERLSVALPPRYTWFHGPAPVSGHAGISLRVEGGNNDYDSLTTELVSLFRHELFHHLQRNINLHLGGNGQASGKEKAWSFFTEGMAELAPSVGQSTELFLQTSPAHAYLAEGNKFLVGNGLRGNLNTSYKKMYPYRAVMYWRFLYEQCGGMSNGVEDPAAGMQIIRQTLITLYAGDIVDITTSTSLVEKLPEIMDRALAGSTCPFNTHTESLVAFARAIYALRLADGRCTAPGTPTGCGFYDPHQRYDDPPVSTITYNGTKQSYSGEINSSFGMDFVEVILDPATEGQPLTLEFDTTQAAETMFNVQLWLLLDSGEGTKPQPLLTQLTSPETLAEVNPEGNRFYVIPAIETAVTNRLGLIITRLDAQESSDPKGAYTIVLYPGP